MIALRINTTMKSMLKLIRFAIVLPLVYLVSFQTAQATHIVGGDLTYRCLGNSQYEIRLTVRRDCLLGDPQAAFDDPAAIGFYDATNFAHIPLPGIGQFLAMPLNPDDTLNQIFISDCTIAGNDVCVHQTTYVDTVTLPFRSTGYILSYQRCCRNQTIQNIINPLDAGMTLNALISAAAQSACNSSPQFGDYPPIYVCVNEPIVFDHSATDIDGDSLVYFLSTPLIGGTQAVNRPLPPNTAPPYDSVDFVNPPYSLANVMGGVPLQIHPSTGLITGTPNTVGQYVVGLCVQSYQNGVLIGRTRRDFQFNVRMCREVPVAQFTPDTDLNCNSLQLDFENTSINADEYLWIFDLDNYPGSSPTSNEADPDFFFPAEGFYDVALIVNDADSICFDTIIQTVGVFESQVTADFEIEIPECSENQILIEPTDFSNDPNNNYDIEEWLWILTYGTTMDTMMGQNPTFILNSSQQGAVLTLEVTSGNGCKDDFSQTFDANVVTFPTDPSLPVCAGDSVALVETPDPLLTYIWSPDSNVTTEAPYLAFPTETTQYYVTVTDGTCVVEDSVLVVVQQLPTLAFEPSTDCKSLVLTIENNSTDGEQYLWDFGDPDTEDDVSSEENPTYTYDQAGVYTVTLFSDDGCEVQVAQDVTISVIDEELEAVTISCFSQDVELNPDFNANYTYEWEPADLLTDPTSPNPSATVEGEVTYYVTITDDLGCMIVDSTMVTIPPDFDVCAPADTSYCGAPQITLTGCTEGLNYQWLDIDGNPLEDGPTLVVAPEDTTSYILMGVDTDGCEKTDTVTLSPAFFAIEVFQDTTICPGDTIGIGVINLDPNQDLSFEWMPSGSIVTMPPTGATVEVAPTTNTVFTVMITNNTLDCMLEQNVQVQVSEFNFTLTGPSVICNGESAELNVQTSDTSDYSFIWSPVEFILDGENTASPTILPLESTDFCVTVINNDYNCVAQEECITVNVSEFFPDTVTIFANPDSVIIGDPVELSTDQDESLDFFWTGPGLDDPTSPRPTAIPTMGGPGNMPEMAEWCVTVTNSDGCTVENCIRIRVYDPFCDERDIFLPNAFSPNGDGQNDVLMVLGNFVESVELHIYSRWGQEVFSTTNQSVGWDGSFGGEKLPPDVFGYYMNVTCPNEKSFNKKGNITLMR